MLVRAVNTTTYGLSTKNAAAARWAIPRGRPTIRSINRTIPHAASAKSTPSQSRSTTQGPIPIACRAAKNGPIGHR